MSKKTVFITGILSLATAFSFAEWRLDEGSGLISTNLNLEGIPLIGKEQPKTLEDQMVLLESTSAGSVATSNETTITPEIRALAEALGNDPLNILDYVRDNIEYIPRVGVYLDARGCLLAGRGSDWDQAVLLSSLLRAAGYTTRYVKGLVLYYDNELLYQFDMDTFAAWDDMRVKRDQVYYSWDAYSGAFLRVWVECRIDGVWQTFDPAFKGYDSHTPANLKTAMQYNFSSFTNTALNGASYDANYVKNLNEPNIRSALNICRENLNDYFRTGTAYTAAYEALGIRTIVPQESTAYQGSVPPYSQGVFSLYLDYWDNIPENCHTKINVQHRGINVSLNAWEVAGRRLSILYDGADGNRPFLSLDGEEIARGTGTTAGSANALNISAIRPVLRDGSASNIANVTNSVDMRLISGSTYVLIHDFETTSEKVQAVHRRQFTRDRQTKSVNSEAVLAGALQLVADSYLNQHDKYQRLVGAVMDCVEDDRCFLGILASTTNGYFIDLPGLWTSCSSKTGNTLNKNTAFSLGTFIDSSLEHGVLEQNQGSENPAVSTIKLLQICNENSKKIFYIHSNNWSSVQEQLQNYSTAEKSAIQTEINDGATGYIPENADITLSNWTGIGYAMESPASVLMAIAGGYDGGYNASGSSFSVPAVEENQGLSVANNDVANVSYTFSDEPVNLFTGDYIVDHTDLALGNGAPLGLRFARHYNSADNATQGVLGNGWRHNLEIRALEVSQGSEALGSDRAIDTASALVQLTVAKDLMTNETDSVQRPMSILVTKWGMDQLTDRRAVLQFGSRNLVYTELEDGSYVPLPGETAELRKENGRFVLEERFGTAYTFNTNGFLETWRDADSNTLSFAYSAGKLQSATDALGRSLSFSYNASNLLDTVSDSTGRQVSFDYDSDGNLTDTTDAAGFNWSYEYNTNNLLTAARDPEGIVTIRNSYDSLGCITQQVSATSNTWKFSIGGNQAVEEDPYGNRTVHWFDDDGRSLGTENALGIRTYIGYDVEGLISYDSDLNDNWNLYIHDNRFNLTRTMEAFFSDLPRETFFGYDELNHLVAVTNALGDVTRYGYDTEHHLTNTVDALSHQTALEYRPDGLLKKKTEAGGRVTEYTYDAYGNPDTVTSTDAGTVDLDYNARGELVKQKDAENKETDFAYDARGLQQSVLYADGSSVSNSYWNNGLLKTVTDARGQTVSNVWNKAYKLQSIHYPDGGTISNTYDVADRLIATTDQRGNTTTYQLDSIGRTTNQQSALNNQQFDYDPIGNITNSVVDPGRLNLWTRSAFDEFNRPLNRQSPLANQQFRYDFLGRMTNRLDAASKLWESEYDALGRKTAAIRPSGAEEQTGYNALGYRTSFTNAEGKVISFGMNAQGRITAITNAIGKVTQFAYDANGNMTNRIDSMNRSTGYVFDEMNRMVSIDYPDASTAAFEYDSNGNRVLSSNQNAQVLFSYDLMNRLAASTQSVSSVNFAVQNSYDLNGNRTNIVYPGGLIVGYSYDEENRLASVSAQNTNGTYAFSFGYDGASRLTGISYPNGINVTVGYDAESRVTNYIHGTVLNHAIARDLRGFKTREDIYAGIVPSFTNGLRQTRTHNDADQLLSAGADEYEYDPNGNLTNSSNLAYAWDYDNRLASAGSTEYLYDGSGVRIGRISGSATNWFVINYADSLKRPLAETDASGTVTRWYVWAGFRLLAHIESDGTIRYYHQDELGSTQALTDGSGAVTDQFAYSPYGQLLSRTGATQIPFGWLGGYGVYHDPVPDLHLTLHRAYSAEQRRFISDDPMGIDGGANLYAYGNLNPLAFVDYLGLYHSSVGYWADQAVATDNTLARASYLTMGALAGCMPDVSTVDVRATANAGISGEMGMGAVIPTGSGQKAAVYSTKGVGAAISGLLSGSVTVGVGWNIHKENPSASDFNGFFNEASVSIDGVTGGVYWDDSWRGVVVGGASEGVGASYHKVYYDVWSDSTESSKGSPSVNYGIPVK
ncbi:MAG: hypothetical protein PWQ89_1498 [Verrucomicrobiota bacterium]|nr:hypothetical protein [Verrucomicrobiota bacterium]